MRKGQLVEVLGSLAMRRPVFHSEADFQHELAWELRSSGLVEQVRLEWPFEVDGRRQYLDLRCEAAGCRVGLELKYMTQGGTLTDGDEVFALRNHGAQDVRRYDFWRDVSRLEGLVASGELDQGFVVALTNDRSYWRAPTRVTFDAAFRLHEGREVEPGELAWGEGTGEGTMRGRSDTIVHRSGYMLGWSDFPRPEGRVVLRYLLLAIEPAAGPSALRVKQVCTHRAL